MVQASGVEQLVRLLLQDAAFARAVQGKDGEGAAAAAVGLVKSHFKAFAAVLRPGSAHAGSGALDSGSPTAAGGKRGAADGGAAAAGGGGGGGKRPSDASGALVAAKLADLRPKDRVLINVSHKRAESDTQGKQGSVVSTTQAGLVKVQVGAEVLDFQPRHLSLLPAKAAAAAGAAGGAGAASTPAAAGAAGAAAGAKGEHRLTLKGAGLRAPLRKVDVIKGMRKELAALEEEVPWKEVSDKWRGARQRWVKSVRGAESAAALAGLMAELHSHLRTDKAAGLFAAGGEWEAALGACAQSEAPNNHVVLAGLWEDMKAGLRAWLAAGSLPGGLEGLDKAAYEQAVATYAVLQDAAMQGPDALEQVPLDHILTTQRDVLALQALIQREMAATHGRLAALLTHATPGASAQPLQLPDPHGGELCEALLLQLAKLPRLQGREASAAAAVAAGSGAVAAAAAAGGCDPDTDADSGSDATDVGEADLMDVC